jgi:PEP-CTERM motif
MEALNVRVISPDIEAQTTTAKRVSSTVCGLLSIVIWFGVLYSSPAAAAVGDRAWSVSQRWDIFWASVWPATLTPDQERTTNDYVTAVENKYYGTDGYTMVGQSYEDGSWLTLAIPASASPTTVALTFGWVDPATEEPVIGGPAIAGVNYYAYVGTATTPLTTNLNDTTNWSLVGESTVSSSGFLYDYTFPTAEQIIVAEPFDNSGNAITLGGIDGYNAALDDESIVVTPEPSTLALLGLGGLAMLRRRRCSK